jgi:hypothetical protein
VKYYDMRRKVGCCDIKKTQEHYKISHLLCPSIGGDRRAASSPDEGARGDEFSHELPLVAKSMVSLASKYVLSEYWSSGSVEHSSGKLRVRGVQIQGVPGKVSNHCDVNV